MEEAGTAKGLAIRLVGESETLSWLALELESVSYSECFRFFLLEAVLD